MSDAEPKRYKPDHAPGVPDQIEAIKELAKQSGHFEQLAGLIEDAIDRLRMNPQGWGDPEYRSKHVDAVVCHAILRPLAFRFVIYEQVRGVVLLSVTQFAKFE